MATVRFYSNEKRLSTGRTLKVGSFLQVYPEKKDFASEDAWRSHWVGAVTGSICVKKSDGTTMRPSPVPTVPQVVSVHAPKSNNYGLSKYGLESFDHACFFTAPAGDYYVGDLCYALKDELYENVFGGTGYSTGLYRFTDGSFFMLSHTSCGDGEYHGTNGKTYLVDAGIIGIAPLSLCKPLEEWSAGEIHHFPDGVRCVFVDGRFEFTSKTGSFEIRT